MRADPWRVVEAQHRSSTRKLVDTLEEQALLEDLIERVKPATSHTLQLHYLLSTPFRYPPLRHGTRFSSRYDRGVWYGSETQGTALCEVAYYRLLFLEGTEADLSTLVVQLTAFRVRVRTQRGIDLVEPPFAAHKRTISSRTNYAATQALGAAMREAGVEFFRYTSARDPEGGTNVAVFTPKVFGTAAPRNFETWECLANKQIVEFSKSDYFSRESLSFRRSDFLVKGVLPSPAL